MIVLQLFLLISVHIYLFSVRRNQLLSKNMGVLFMLAAFVVFCPIFTESP